MSKSGARILVVDDEIEIMRALQRSLTAHGFEVFTAASGEEALEAITHYRPDLMLLDLGLPGMSGLEVCKRVRAQSNLPIIVLSVKDTERDKVMARVDFAQRLVQINGQEVKLTPTEYDLLKALIKNSGKIMTRHMLLSQVWGTGYGTESHYLHVYIGQLRRKIEPDPAHPRFILTISGVGYRFNADD